MAKPKNGRPVTDMPASASTSGKVAGKPSSRAQRKKTSEVVAAQSLQVSGNPAPLSAVAVAQTEADLRQLQGINKQLESDLKRLSDELDRRSRHIHVLNQSLIAQQNYVIRALAAINPINVSDTRSSIVAELLWLLKQTIKGGPVRALKSFKSYRALKFSRQFDAGFYANQVDGAKAFSAAQLIRHYVSEGFRQGFDPSAAFSVRKYLDFYPDVKSSGAEPLSHYLLHGEAEHRIALPSDTAQTHVGGIPFSGFISPMWGLVSPKTRKRLKSARRMDGHCRPYPKPMSASLDYMISALKTM